MIPEWFSRQSFGRNALTLVSGTAAGQVITVIAAPVLSRLYSPEAFGAYAVYATVILLSASLVSGRYELAIVPAELEDEASGLFVLCCVLAVGFGALTFLVARQGSIMSALGFGPILPYATLVAISVALNGIFQALLQYWIRYKNFRPIAVSQIIRSGGMLAAQVSLPEVNAGGPVGLIAGQLVGIILPVLVLGRTLCGDLIAWGRRHKQHIFSTLLAIAGRFRRHPIFLPWGGLTDSIGNKLPVLILSSLYGPVFLGMYALADRVLRTPSLLLGQSSAQLLFQKMTEEETKLKMSKLITAWAVGTTAVYALPFILLFLYGKSCFAFALGEKWSEAGVIAAVLIPTYWGNLVVSPVSGLFIVANRQGLAVCVQMLFLIAGCGSLWIGHRLFSNGVQTLGLYSASQFCVYIIYYGLLLNTARDVSRKESTRHYTCVA